MTLSRRTAIVPKVVMSATAAAVASIPVVACLGHDDAGNTNYILLAIGGFAAVGNAGGVADTPGKAGSGGYGGIDVLLAGAAGEDDAAGAGGVAAAKGGAGGSAGAISSGGVGFIVLAAAAFGGEAGGRER
jgi:hypothetical protein